MPEFKILGWTPSRYEKWKLCPAKVKYEDLLKMCPVCFKGRVSGGYDGEPVVCDTCDEAQPERAPLERGNALDAALTVHLSGTEKKLTEAAKKPGKTAVVATLIEAQVETLSEATRHPVIAALVKKLRKMKNASYQETIVMNNKWERVTQYTKNAWARLKLDVLVLTPKYAEIIDWKSGNIKNGEIKEKDSYADSMRAYQMAVLSVYPQPEARVRMAFLDAPPKLPVPFKELVTLKRKDLETAKEKWEEKITPMMNDTRFAPRPGFYCGWCPFQKAKGGPCQF